jgi:hypothetical protein
MTGFTDYSAGNNLAYIVGKTAMPTIPSPCYLALFTAVGIDAGTGFTEVSGSAYARQSMAASFAAPSGSAPTTIVSNAAIAFPTPTGSWGTVIAFGVYDAITGGNLLFWDYLGNFSWLPTTVSSASPGILTVKAHGYSAADQIVFSTEFGGTGPSFSASNFTGLLAVVAPATDSFSVTNSAVAVNTSSTGSGMVRKVSSQAIASGVVASFASGALTLAAA